ncbi:asparaginase [Sulfurimonas sp. SAG-AH-194-L11]|nr:asparaginase domain-containing protein [Sulfurimonas sp. SAG-AH-194-L11]MDF1877826.1 asparaginase [Sulfurimonas sp. SAG-AH-194-L11]
MLILNCGGTFNKRYNSLNGELEVPFDNYAIDSILKSTNNLYTIAGAVYKDSLDMTIDDRSLLADIIRESTENIFVLIHGTDTISLSAEFFAEIFEDKIIILTAAMVPYEIDKVEASLNLGIALGFSKAVSKNGIYICMNGLVEKYDLIEKNRALGRFELVK